MSFFDAAGPGDVLIAELGPEEGITIPGGARYWFEKTGDVDLELLQCVRYDPSGESQRVNVEKHKDRNEETRTCRFTSKALLNARRVLAASRAPESRAR